MFTTKVEILESPIKITHNDGIVALGSCFSENIGKKMSDAGFNIDVNPFGVLYNPVSIRNSLQFLLDGKQFTEEDLFFDGSLYNSFAHSSLFSDVNAEKCLQKINSRLEQSRVQIREGRFLFITFGTSWIFENTENGEIVSNCHKLPAKKFVRYSLAVEDIVNDYRRLIQQLNTQNRELKLIFSVSPIRHWKDGAHENSLSKARLLLAVNLLQKEFEDVHYFPAYELLMDELRDYRYYASDMLHPSETAINYIWERFADCYFSDETKKIKFEIEQLNADFAHRPLHPESANYQKFAENIEARKRKIAEKYPNLKF